MPTSQVTSQSAHLNVKLISCSAMTSCYALVGGSQTFSGISMEQLVGSTWHWKGNLDSQISDINATSLSCPTSSWCAIAADPGNSITPRTPAFMAEWSNGSFIPLRTPVLEGGGILSAVSCTSTTFCVAVGFYSATKTNEPLAERWDGRAWSVMSQPIGNPEAFPGAVACTSPTFCMAVGTQGGLGPYAQVWNGSVWRLTERPRRFFPSVHPGGPGGPHEPTPSLNYVSCSSSTHCLATGELVGSAQLWNGTSWQVQHLGSQYGGAVSCATSGECYLIASAQTISSKEMVHRLSRGAWTTIGAASTNKTSFIGLGCFSSSQCIVIGSESGWDTQATSATWDGSTWTALQFASN